MDAAKTKILMSLISSAIGSRDPVLPDSFGLNDALIAELYNVSRAHGVAALTGTALSACGLLEQSSVSGAYGDSIFYAMYRYESSDFLLKSVSAVFEAEGIPFIPLKGAINAKLYPEPWMRMSCDIDILVHETDTERAVQSLTNKLSLKAEKKGKHDITLLSESGICLELHFALLEDGFFRSAAKTLSAVWSHASPVSEGRSEHRMSEEMHCLYHIAHMAQHFVCGGCGIRPFIDLYLITDSFADGLPHELLGKADLVRFGESVTKLSRVWFAGEEHSELTLEIQSFIIDGGSFGSAETRLAAIQSVTGGKKGYIKSRVFLPYGELKTRYPILEKYRFLTPCCEICRLFSLLVGKKKIIREDKISKIDDLPDEYATRITELFKNILL